MLRGALVLAVSAVLLTSACAGPPSPAAASSDPPPSPSTPEPAASDPPTCEPEVLAGVDATVAGQLAAFADGDIRAALGFASASFRASVTLTSFRAIIEEGYPEVAASTGHAILDCRSLDAENAQALVSVTGKDGTTARLGYRLVREPEGWRIDGASTLARAEVQVA